MRFEFHRHPAAERRVHLVQHPPAQHHAARMPLDFVAALERRDQRMIDGHDQSAQRRASRFHPLGIDARFGVNVRFGRHQLNHGFPHGGLSLAKPLGQPRRQPHHMR